jgi:FtsZ-binding cell division protein ZapB
MHGAFARIPLLGIDILRSETEAKLYAIEVNAGGNVWHFSSHNLAHRREKFSHLADEMKAQFGAWQAAARALVRKTDQYAA